MKNSLAFLAAVVVSFAAFAGEFNGGRTVPVHRFVPVDRDGDKVSVQARMPAAMSQEKTCAQCHDVDKMHGGSHFRSGGTNDVVNKVNREPWFLCSTNSGTCRVVTLADRDKEAALPLIRRFYNLGFNIEATSGTADFLRKHGLRTRRLGKLSEGSNDIYSSISRGHVNYVINTIDLNQHNTRLDGYEIRRAAVENNVTIFTSLETVRVLLDVLEEITLGISTIDADYDM